MALVFCCENYYNNNMNPSQFLRHVEAQQQSSFLSVAKRDLSLAKRRGKRLVYKEEFTWKFLQRDVDSHNSHYHPTSPFFIPTGKRK